MALNINVTETTVGTKARRTSLVDDVVAELTMWGPREVLAGVRRAQRVPLSFIHLDVLLVLDTRAPLAMSALAEALDVSVASATGIVGRMEKHGLVERRHAEDDRRVVLVQPTQAGHDVLTSMDERRRTGLRGLLETMDEGDLTMLLTGIRALHAARIRWAISHPELAAAHRAAMGASATDTIGEAS
jgi:DNA-binding MarR family transcriptional regulator